MQVGVAEFLEKVSKLKTNEEKINALKANDSYVLRIVLQGAFDPDVKWLIPTGKPPYKPNELVDQEHILIREARKLVYFVDGFYPNLNQGKRENMFIELLEQVDPRDAEMLIAIKDKQLPYKGIDVYHAYYALEGLFPNMQPPPEPAEGGDTSVKSFREEVKVVCPHCGVAGKTEKMMKLYHFDNCKKRKVEEVSVNTQAESITNDVIEIEPVLTSNGVYQATDLSSLQEFKQE